MNYSCASCWVLVLSIDFWNLGFEAQWRRIGVPRFWDGFFFIFIFCDAEARGVIF